MNKKVIIKMPRNLIDEETGKPVKKYEQEKYLVQDNKDFNFSAGVLKKEELKQEKTMTLNKDTLVIFNASFIDLFRKIKRGAQIINIKDLGYIASYTGINKTSKILDAGSGSGASACFFANLTEEVHSMDVSKNNLELSKQNAETLQIKNIVFQEKNIYEYKEKKDYYDLFVLDVPEPWNALETASLVLKNGGYLVVYAPNINQIHQVFRELPKNLLYENTIEIIEREWNVSERVLRPATKDFSHTAFLSFIRKIPFP